MRLSDHVADLVHGAGDEVHKLKFRNRAHAVKRSANRGPDDCRLGNGRINHALGTESVDKSFGDFECATVYSNVFAQTKDSRIALHLFRNSLSNSFEVSEYRHRLLIPDHSRGLCRGALHCNCERRRIELANRETPMGLVTAVHAMSQDTLI